MHIDFVMCKKGDPSRFLTSILLQNIIKLKGDPLETSKNLEKQKMNFEKSHSAEKFEKRDPLGFLHIRCRKIRLSCASCGLKRESCRAEKSSRTFP